MRIVLIAMLTFVAGLTIGALVLGNGALGPDETSLTLRATGQEAPSDTPSPEGQSGPTRSASSVTEASEDGPSLAPRSDAVRFDPASARARRAWAWKHLQKGYPGFLREGEPSLPPELERQASREAAAWAEQQLENGYAGWLADYARKLRATGTLPDPPRLAFQLRGTGRLGNFAAASDRWKKVLRKTPLDLEAPPHPEDPFEAYSETGVVPLDRVLVLERIDVVYSLGYDPAAAGRAQPGAGGDLTVSIGGRDALDLFDTPARNVRGSLLGRMVVRPPWGHPNIGVDLQQGVVGLVAHGRLVSKKEARDLRDAKWRWAPEGDDGLLGSELVLLQVRADHGGGNPNTVALDGSRSVYVDGMAGGNLWDDTLPLQSKRTSLAWCENVGVLPDGHVYRITRIDWRARLDPRSGGHSRFRIRGPRGWLVERTGKAGEAFQGTWTGKVDVRPGQERRVFLECAMYAMGEAILLGTLVKQGE